MIILDQYPLLATSNARELQWKIEFWQREYANAGSQKELAWKMLDDAIEEGKPRDLIRQLAELAEIFDEIARGTWELWQDAKRDYLALLS